MQSKEFRIGNLIYDASENVHQITSIDGVDLGLLGCSIELRFAKPITLTEEWLIKFGFNKIHPLDTDEHCFATFCKNGINIDLPCFEFNLEEISKEIKFVHELQNLYFALTGRELIVKSRI